MATGFLKKNIEYTKRNGQSKDATVIIQYVNNQSKDGADGEDSFNVILSPNNKTFTAGSYNAVAQDYEVMVYAYRGTAQVNAYVVDASIVGAISGALDVSIEAGSNGTNHTKLILHVTENLSADAGTLVIPVVYNVDSYDSSTVADLTQWDPDTNTLASTEAIYSWTLGKTGQSQFNLDLSNESATINADEDGHILLSAARPPCKATLSFGSDNNLSGVYYSASFSPSVGTKGIGINHQTGQILYDSSVHAYDSTIPDASFDFGDVSTNTVLNITIDASYDGRIRGSQTMKIQKALPGQAGPDGQPGEDAVSRWIELSADQVKIDASNNVVPSTITAAAWKQVGGNMPTTDASCNIKWFYDSSTEQAYTGPITVDATKSYMTFKLYMGNTYMGETETVPILKDGKQGEQGIRGAVLRGPVLWDSSTDVNVSGLASRWFYCGVQTHFGPNPPARPQESEFIDVILHNNKYYVCDTNYEQANNALWADVSSNWTEADSSYNFVAANVLLANNAKINFLTDNELYLMDSSNHITGGAAGGEGISFWAGHQNPSSAPFQVDYQGNITAKSGTFSGYLQMPYINMSELTHTTVNTHSTYTLDTRAYVIVSGGGPGNTVDIILPTPSAALNGFVYYLLAVGKRASMQTTSEGVCCYIKVNGNDASILDYVYQPYEEEPFTQAGIYGGKYQFVCAEIGGSYNWLLTEATGGAQMHNSNNSKYRCFRPVFGYVGVNGTPTIRNIEYVSEAPQNPDVNTMYVIYQSS